MKSIVALMLAMVTTFSFAKETECRVYTPEQENILKLAYEVGYSEDLGLTLAAIVKQESFVGPYIVRDNPNDYSTHEREDGSECKIRGSYGVTHILLTTGAWLEGETNLWRARDTIARKLVTDDHYAIQLALKKLKSVQKKDQAWRSLVARYNGAGPAARAYAEEIAGHVREFQRCGLVGDVLSPPEPEIHVFGEDGEETIYYMDYSLFDCRYDRLNYKELS